MLRERIEALLRTAERFSEDESEAESTRLMFSHFAIAYRDVLSIIAEEEGKS